MPSVIVLDPLAEQGIRVLEAAEGIDVTIRTGLKGDELRLALQEFDGAICRSGVRLNAEALTDNRKLKAIVRAGVGTDNIDKQIATRRGIIVMNTPTGNTISTAEHAFALMLAMARNISAAHQSLREGRWDRKAFMGTQLADKSLGIVGLGRIGREVAKRALAFQMTVIGYDPFMTAEMTAKLGIQPAASVAELLPQVDFLTVHTPLTAETRGLINQEALQTMKPGVRVINCARGGIYDESALQQGLESGQLGGVALDVYESEPCTDSPLLIHPASVCTPHLGASTEEAQTQVAIEAAELMVNFLQTGRVRHAVNTVALDPHVLNLMRGQLDLSYRLGLLLSQLQSGQSSKCQLTFRGEVAGQDTRLLNSAFCAGLIGRVLDEDVNIVNAELLLRERGIELSSISDGDQGAFSSSIRAELQMADGSTIAASGTLFGNAMSRLVMLDSYQLEAYLDGVLLIFRHRDVPGIIGRVGTIFGKHHVNIAQMSVGRAIDEPGGQAIGVLNLDSTPSDATLAEVAAHDDIVNVAVVQLPHRHDLPDWLQA